MGMNDFKVHVACTKKRCRWIKDASSAGFARLYGMRHFEQTGHVEFHVWRQAQETVTFPDDIAKHAVLRQNHHE